MFEAFLVEWRNPTPLLLLPEWRNKQIILTSPAPVGQSTAFKTRSKPVTVRRRPLRCWCLLILLHYYMYIYLRILFIVHCNKSIQDKLWIKKTFLKTRFLDVFLCCIVFHKSVSKKTHYTFLWKLPIIDPETLLRKLKSLDKNKCAGPDGFHGKVQRGYPLVEPLLASNNMDLFLLGQHAPI